MVAPRQLAGAPHFRFAGVKANRTLHTLEELLVPVAGNPRECYTIRNAGSDRPGDGSACAICGDNAAGYTTRSTSGVRLVSPVHGARSGSCYEWSPHVPLRIFSNLGEQGLQVQVRGSLAPGATILFLSTLQLPTGKAVWWTSPHRMILHTPWVVVPPRLETTSPALRLRFA